MKKLGLFLIALTAVLFIGCSAQSSPEKVVKAQFQAMQKGDFEKAFALSSQSLEASDEEKQSAIELVKLVFADVAIENFEVTKVEENGDKATVSVQFDIKDKKSGETEKQTSERSVVKIEGKWYVD